MSLTFDFDIVDVYYFYSPFSSISVSKRTKRFVLALENHGTTDPDLISS